MMILRWLVIVLFGVILIWLFGSRFGMWVG